MMLVMFEVIFLVSYFLIVVLFFVVIFVCEHFSGGNKVYDGIG